MWSVAVLSAIFGAVCAIPSLAGGPEGHDIAARGSNPKISFVNNADQEQKIYMIGRVSGGEWAIATTAGVVPLRSLTASSVHNHAIKVASRSTVDITVQRPFTQGRMYTTDNELWLNIGSDYVGFPNPGSNAGSREKKPWDFVEFQVEGDRLDTMSAGFAYHHVVGELPISVTIIGRSETKNLAGHNAQCLEQFCTQNIHKDDHYKCVKTGGKPFRLADLGAVADGVDFQRTCGVSLPTNAVVRYADEMKFTLG